MSFIRGSFQLTKRQIAIAFRFKSTKQASPYVTTPFYHRNLVVHKAIALKPRPDENNLSFGEVFTDHMFCINWDVNVGWKRPRITEFQNFSIHPASKVLHYAVAAFEGMKAYRGVDGKIRLFRPDLHMERMVRTAVRASLPKFEPQEMVKIISDLVALDKDWVPSAEDTSLYIRPTLIGNDHALHVGKASSAKLFVILSPVGKYYKTGLKPVTLLADPAHVRAFPGGVGEFKMACNYAPTIKISTDAAELGCQQVLWLFDKDEKVTEVGTMNFMTFWINEDGEKELITPPLTDGIILPGITRRSILELAREWGEFKVTEAYLTMAQIKKAVKERRVLEMFGTGTAAVVTPVGKIVYRDKALCNVQEIIIPTMQHKPNLTQRFYKTLTDIQYGRAHKQDWTHTVC